MSKSDSKEASPGLRTWLGQKFHLADDPRVYVAIGRAGNPIMVLLQEITTEEIKKLTPADFERLAIRAET